MTSIDRTTIPISKVAVIVLTVGGLLANYFTTLNAVKSGIQEIRSETKLEIQDLKNDDKMIRQEIDGVRSDQKDMKDAIVSYIGTGMKPEEPRRKNYR